MKLHANAALSLKGRRVLARRVVVEGWTVTEAAAAAEVSVRCARKWAKLHSGSAHARRSGRRAGSRISRNVVTFPTRNRGSDGRRNIAIADLE
jgi:transposase